jgi:cardiolipin synthase
MTPMASSESGVPLPTFVGGNQVSLLCGGAELFPAMCRAIAAAEVDVWFATYIFHDDTAAQAVADALAAAARRGIAVHVVVDGFGCLATLPALRQRLAGSGVRLEVFRPLDRWYAWLQPGQLRRLHQKLCVVDDEVAFVGGINIIDDCHDLNHGWSDLPRLDFAVEVQGPLAADVKATARAMWSRAYRLRVSSCTPRPGTRLTTRQPAASPAATPVALSSTTRHCAAGTPQAVAAAV